MRRYRDHLARVEQVMGALLVLTGVLFLTGQLTVFSFWIISMFPALGQIG
jgi:cytochrome c-type biogenesis protein